jgi:hypothetical protein
METIKEFFSTAPYIAWSLVSVVLALAVIASNWPKVKWWWHNTWYSFPLIGKITSLSKDPNKDPVDPSWFKAERTLCRDYKHFIRIQDEHDFNEKVTYLTKAGDNGRRGTPWFIWVLNVALVFVEAMGFSYVLAGYTIPGASENLQQTGAYGIAFLLSVILVALTHFSGHQLYKSLKVKHARQEWVEGGRKGKTSTAPVALAKPQSIDDDQPGYVQLMNRVGTSSSYVLIAVTGIFVVVVAIFATYVRGQVLEKQLHQQITGQISSESAVSVSVSVSASNDGLNMSANKSDKKIQMPPDDRAANEAASKKAAEDAVNIDRHGGWGTFVVLAFIFFFLQILGVIFGYLWGFAGRDSAAAFRSIGSGRYSSYSEVRDRYKEVADIAQSKLEHLQQKLMDRNSIGGNDGLHTSKTFYDFMEAELNRESAERANEIERTKRRGLSERQAVATAEPQPAGSKEMSLEEILQRLHEMGEDKGKKKSFIQSLSPELQVAVLKALKSQKDEDARKVASRINAELDDVL